MNELASLIPVATLILGYFGTLGTESFRDNRARRLLKEQRHDEFQRETLLALQETAFALVRATARVWHADEMIERERGHWRSTLLPEGISDEHWAATSKIIVLVVRVQDERVATLTKNLRELSSISITTHDKAESDRTLTEMMKIFEELNVVVGELLKSNY